MERLEEYCRKRYIVSEPRDGDGKIDFNTFQEIVEWLQSDRDRGVGGQERDPSGVLLAESYYIYGGIIDVRYRVREIMIKHDSEKGLRDMEKRLGLDNS